MSSALPDFLIIGRPKCGTTTLARWLDEQADIFFCPVKEARFFGRPEGWRKGLDWYSSLFRGAEPGQLIGEATPGYTHPTINDAAATQIAETLPAARLIYMVRDPVERIRSDFRHRRIVGDEHRTFEQVLADPTSRYIPHTKYYRCLEPFIDRFPKEQILVIRTEDLNGDASAWAAVLEHLGLPWRPPPDTAYNVSADKGFYRAPLKFLRKHEVRQRFYWIPRPVRMVAKRFARSRGDQFSGMLEESRSPIAPELLEPVWEDIERLERWMGVSEPLWPRRTSSTTG